jgi:L-ascorbate metabolism protein UlaG (beta-lactamase superfamily)
VNSPFVRLNSDGTLAPKWRQAVLLRSAEAQDAGRPKGRSGLVGTSKPQQEKNMASEQHTRITWLGHATVLIKTPRGTNILIDPFIEHNPKYPKDFELPSKVHYILLTHGHGDHISDVVPVAKKHGSTVVAIYELADYVAGQGVEKTIGMNLGGAVQLDDATATMVDARHSSGAQDKNGTHYVGVAAGFVITAPGGPVIYDAGDTTVFGDMRLIGELYQPEVALLPIGGYYTMGPKEAALAARLVGAKTILPTHFGTFPQLTGTPAELATLVGSGFRVVQWNPGDSF